MQVENETKWIERIQTHMAIINISISDASVGAVILSAFSICGERGYTMANVPPLDSDTCTLSINQTTNCHEKMHTSIDIIESLLGFFILLTILLSILLFIIVLLLVYQSRKKLACKSQLQLQQDIKDHKKFAEGKEECLINK